MVKQRISYIDPTNIADVEMRNEFERCRTRGTPRPESQAIRAHVPSTFWSFAKSALALHLPQLLQMYRLH